MLFHDNNKPLSFKTKTKLSRFAFFISFSFIAVQKRQLLSFMGFPLQWRGINKRFEVFRWFIRNKFVYCASCTVTGIAAPSPISEPNGTWVCVVYVKLRCISRWHKLIILIITLSLFPFIRLTIKSIGILT